MPKFAANLTMLFNELDFLDRFDAARNSGFKAVEYLFPYAYDRKLLAEKLASNGLTQVLHNLPAGDWAAGERGIACLPDRVTEFRDGVGKAIEYAKALGCTQLNCLAGVVRPGADLQRVYSTFVDNLRFAASALGAEGIRLLIEPINTRDIPGFYLCHSQQAIDLISDVGGGNIFLQYDIYHMQVMEGDLVPTIERNLPRIAHIQIADTPGRNEPGTGEINYPFVLDRLDAMGYRGWIGCEYKPKAGTVQGLGWFAPYAARRRPDAGERSA
jgi:hydroxypyruvate isomerase